MVKKINTTEYSPSGVELVSAAELYRQLARGHGHRCMRGRAPEGFFEIWPDWKPVILHISFEAHAELQTMLDAYDARRMKTNIEHGTGPRRSQVPRQRVFIDWQGIDAKTARQTRKIATQEAA